MLAAACTSCGRIFKLVAQMCFSALQAFKTLKRCCRWAALNSLQSTLYQLTHFTSSSVTAHVQHPLPRLLSRGITRQLSWLLVLRGAAPALK